MFGLRGDSINAPVPADAPGNREEFERPWELLSVSKLSCPFFDWLDCHAVLIQLSINPIRRIRYQAGKRLLGHAKV